MATVALWHLGVTGILAGALVLIILTQSLGAALQRLRRSARGAVQVPLQSRSTVEPRAVRVAVRTTHEQAPAMASAAGAR